MHIFIVFLFSCILSMVSYNTSELKLLSLTLWSCLMWCIFSAIYLLTFNTMNSDISVWTTIVIITNILATYFGERLGNIHLSHHKTRKDNTFNRLANLMISKQITYIVFTIMFIVGTIRMYYFYLFVNRYGSGSVTSLISLLGVGRTAIVADSENLYYGGPFVSFFVYVSVAITTVYIFVFMYNWIVLNQKKIYLLLPVLSDIYIELPTTNRSFLILIVVDFLVAYFCILIKQRKFKKIQISPKLMLFIIFFGVGFFAYGANRSRSYVTSSRYSFNLISTVQSYSCAAIYGLDQYLSKGWDQNKYFGEYTLQKIYDFFGVEHDYVPSSNLEFFRFGTERTSRSNIYTSCTVLMQDYGYIGMLILAFFSTFIFTKIVYILLQTNITSMKFYILLFLTDYIILNYLYQPIAERIFNVILTPATFFRIIVLWFMLKYVLKIKGIRRI